MTSTELLRVLDAHYPILLLGVLASIEDVGNFRVAMATAAFIGMPSTIMNIVIMSSIAQWHTEGRTSKLQFAATLSSAAIFASVLVITLATYFFGEPLIRAVFGAEFLPAWTPLVLIGIAYCVNGYYGSASTILNMCGQERIVTSVYAVGPIVGVATTVALFPQFGIAACGIAMIVTELIKGWWMAGIARRELGVELSLIPAALAAARGKAAVGNPDHA